MTIKKMYVDIVQLLDENQDKKVKSIMDQVLSLASAKTNRSTGNTYLKDDKNETVAVKCYYFKRWMPVVGPEAVEFGLKKSTTTGLNTMSKLGAKHWTKQNNQAKTAHSAMLDALEQGATEVANIGQEKAKIESDRLAVIDTDLGFETLDEVKSYLTDNGITLANI